MFTVQQLGESANDLVKKWKGGYRNGFPDYYAVEFPVREMNYDRSRVYTGVIGRKYPDAQTERYYYLYDPNLYLQPGISDAEPVDDARAATARKIVYGTGIVLLSVIVAGALTWRSINHKLDSGAWRHEPRYRRTARR